MPGKEYLPDFPGLQRILKLPEISILALDLSGWNHPQINKGEICKTSIKRVPGQHLFDRTSLAIDLFFVNDQTPFQSRCSSATSWVRRGGLEVMSLFCALLSYIQEKGQHFSSFSVALEKQELEHCWPRPPNRAPKLISHCPPVNRGSQL